MDIEEIAIGYAIQTNNLRINKKKIAEAECIKATHSFRDHSFDTIINLGKFRDSLYEDNEDLEGSSVRWDGWANCLYDCGMDFTDQEILLARLLDEKRIFVQARAKFKRLLYCEGTKLINKENK